MSIPKDCPKTKWDRLYATGKIDFLVDTLGMTRPETLQLSQLNWNELPTNVRKRLVEKVSFSS